MPNPVASPATKTNKRGERTKALLLDVAGRLLALEPASAVSLDRIAREAGVAKSSVLWHFGNKESLYLAVVDRWFGEFEAQLLTDLDMNAPLGEVLHRFLAAYEDFLIARPEVNAVLFALLFDAPRGSALRARIAQMYDAFRQTMAARTAAAGAGFDAGDASLLIAALDGLFLQWFIDPDEFDLAAAFARLRRLGALLFPTEVTP